MMEQFLICYPEGKFKALTLSYDDGIDADRRLVDIFNKWGLKSTFHLNSGRFGENDVINNRKRLAREEIKAVYQGHEIACHTVTHPTIERCPLDKVAMEILEDRKQLETIAGYPVNGLSYPNGSFTEKIQTLLPSLGIEYSRVVGSSHTYSLPSNWYHWLPTCHHNHNLLEHAREFSDLDKKQYLYLFYVWGHSFEFDAQDNWELMEEFASSIGHHDDIWYVTNIEFKRYMTAAQNLVFSVKGDMVLNPSNLPIWIRKDQQVLEIKPGINNI